MPETLYNRYRPKTLAEVVGQDDAVATLESFFDNDRVPQALLFTGPSGSGKTTLARIVAAWLGMRPDIELREVNCASCEPLDTVRRMTPASQYDKPINVTRQGWLLEEVQSWSRAQFAQQSLLKILEDPASWAYYLLCTTDPKKILEAVRSRCFEVKTKRLADDSIDNIVREVASAERMKLDDKVLKAIVDLADGSARVSLVLLESVSGLDEAERLKHLEKGVNMPVGFDLSKAIFSNAKWPEVAKLLDQFREEDAEGVRRNVMGYARSVMLKNTPERAMFARWVIQCFRDDTFTGGHPLLAAMAYDAVCRKPTSK